MRTPTQAYVYGMIGRELQLAAQAGGGDLRENEIDGLPEDPVKWVGMILRRLHAAHLIDPERDERIGRIMDMLDIERAPRQGDEQDGSFWLGWYAYDPSQLSVPQAAEALGVSTQRVYALLESRDLRGYKTGREWRIYERSVTHRLEARRSEESRRLAASLMEPPADLP